MSVAGPVRPARILLLAEMYPPDPRVGGFRARKLALALRAAGHDVHVMVMRAGDLTSGPLGERLTLHVVAPWRSPLQLLRAVRTGRADSGEAPTAGEEALAGTAASLGSSELRGLKGALLSLLRTPDEWQGAVPAMARAAERIGGAPFDLVYSTAPAFSMHLAAMRIARRWGTPWVMELRDPWRSSGSSRAAEASALSDWVDRRLYERCVRHASLLVTVADGAAALLRTHVGDGRADRVISVLNGIDEIALDRPPRPARDAVRVVYTGSVYPPRDPGPLAQAIARVHAQGGPEFELVFAGVTTPAETARIRAFTAGPAAARTQIHAWLPQPEARALIRDADLVLLPAQRWVRQIPNKLFDYVAARVPILALVEPESEAEQMLAAVGGHHVIRTTDAPERVEAITRQALAAAASADRLPVGDAAVLQPWTVANQQRRLVRAVEALLAGRPIPHDEGASQRAAAAGAADPRLAPADAG